MNCLRTGLAVALLLAVPSSALTQDAGGARPARDELRLPDAAGGWLVPAAELPDGVTLSDELVTNSATSWEFFDDPTRGAALPGPDQKLSQTLVTENGDDEPLRGSLMVLRYEGGVPDDVAAVVPGLLWGDEGAPSGLRPENIVIEGPDLVILSFAIEDSTGDWLRGWLGQQFGVRIPHSWASLTPVISEAIAALRAGDGARGLAVLDARADDISDYALAQYLAGDLAARQTDWARAEQSYGRALQLHEQRIDRLPGGEFTEWVVLDAFGLSLIIQGKDADGIPILLRAVSLADALEKPKEGARSRYNLACAYAKTERFDEAHATLARCIEVDADYYADMAREDSDFAAARERDDFKELLEIQGGADG